MSHASEKIKLEVNTRGQLNAIIALAASQRHRRGNASNMGTFTGFAALS